MVFIFPYPFHFSLSLLPFVFLLLTTFCFLTLFPLLSFISSVCNFNTNFSPFFQLIHFFVLPSLLILLYCPFLLTFHYFPFFYNLSLVLHTSFPLSLMTRLTFSFDACLYYSLSFSCFILFPPLSASCSPLVYLLVCFCHSVVLIFFSLLYFLVFFSLACHFFLSYVR